MTEEFEGLKILASREAAQRITRRHFLAGSAVAVFSGSVLLAACGGGDKNALNIYNWAEYNDPAIFTRFTDEVGPATTVSIYDSNEQAVAKLESAEGTSGYDIVVPSDVYVGQLIELDLLEKMDKSKIPNFKNLEDQYKAQPFDPGNDYSVCKDWGSTGWIVDTSIVKEPINSWKDFQNAAMGVASGNMSVLDTPGYVAAIYAWGEGLNWVTEDEAELDATEDFIVNKFAPHIKAFDSYPGINLAQGNYAISQIWNGDARGGLLSVDDPERYQWSIGKPVADLWMDNWCIVKGGPNVDAAHQWINFILDPDVSFQDMQYHGYHPGITGIQERAEKAGLEHLDIIFFDDETVSGLQDNALNSGQARRVAIWEAAHAAAGACVRGGAGRGVGGAGAMRWHLPRFALAAPAWVWFIAFFAIPVLWIVFYAIWGFKPDPFTRIAIGDPTLQNFRDALTSTFFKTFKGTLQISLLGTALCFLIGFPFAYWLSIKVSAKRRSVLLVLVIVPFWTNFLIRTIGWRILLQPEGPLASFLGSIGLLDGPLRILDTRGAVQLGVVYNYLPLMIFPLFVALDRLDPALREASKDLGAGGWTTFRQVTLPLAMPGVVAGLLLVFIPLTGDFITAAILGGAKGNMVGNMVFGRFLIAQNWAQGSAMAILLIAMIVGTLAVFAAIGLGIRTAIRRGRDVDLSVGAP